MKQKIVLLAVGLILLYQSWAQKTSEDIATSFLKNLKLRSDTTTSIELSRHSNPANNLLFKQSLNSIVDKVKTSDTLIDWLWICDMELTKNLIMKSYLLKYDIKPYRIDFLFYKKKDQWFVQDVSIDVDLFSDLKHAGRAEKIRPNNLTITY